MKYRELLTDRPEAVLQQQSTYGELRVTYKAGYTYDLQQIIELIFIN